MANTRVSAPRSCTKAGASWTVSLFGSPRGVKKVDNPNFRQGPTPYLWEYQGKAEWYVYQPTPGDMEQLREAFDAYAELYQPPAMEMQM